MNFETEFKNAIRLVESGQAKQAVELCDALLQQQPKNPDVLHIQGYGYLAIGEIANAKNCFVQSLK